MSAAAQQTKFTLEEYSPHLKLVCFLEGSFSKTWYLFRKGQFYLF